MEDVNLDAFIKLNELSVTRNVIEVPLKCCLTDETGITNQALLHFKRHDADCETGFNSLNFLPKLSCNN